MIINVKYRDIPFEDVLNCMTEWGRKSARRKNWEKLRGTSVAIQVPAIRVNQWKYLKCGGPFFKLAGSRKGSVCCPHIAEIGD